MKKISIILTLCATIISVAYAQNSILLYDTNPASLADTTTLLNTLKEKERELNTKEADLNAREIRLNALESDLKSREENIVAMRDEVTKKLDELAIKQDEELDKLAKIYQASKAKSAAAILVKTELDQTVALFRRMTPSVAGKILNEMAKVDPAYASNLTMALSPSPAFDNNTP